MSKNMTLINSIQFQDRVSSFYDTDMTIAEIALELGTLPINISEAMKIVHGNDGVKARKKRLYALSKEGDKNPAFGKFKEESIQWKGGKAADGKGYMMVLKPDWYTGRPGSKYIFEHTAVMCEALGLSELPAGFTVHHIDKDKLNNDLSNLALLTNRAHSRLHARERATTIPKGSRA